MAFPQVEATNNSAETTNQTSHTVALPAGIQAGETLLVYFSCDWMRAVTFPAGWTEIFEDITSNTLAIAWRKADGGEGASITVTTSDTEQSVHISHRISGAADPTVAPPEVSVGATGNTTNPNPDSLNPGGGTKEYLWIAVASSNDGREVYTAYPTNYTGNRETYQSLEHIAGCNIAVATREIETSVQDPGTFTIEASEAWASCTVAVYPELPPAPSPVTDGDLIGIRSIRGYEMTDAHASTHQSGGSDPIKLDDLAAPDDNTDLDASTTKHGLFPKLDHDKLDGIAAGADVTGSNAPQAHKTTHQNGGGDEVDVVGLSGLLADDQHVLDAEVKLIKLDDFATPDDNTDLDFGTARHGLVPKGTNVGDFLKDDGTWAAGGGVSDPHGAGQHTDITRTVFLSVGMGKIQAGTETAIGRFPAISGAANGNEPDMYFSLYVPDGFLSFTKMEALWMAIPASGNMRWGLDAQWGANGESQAQHSETISYGTTATAGAYLFNLQEPANALSLVNLAIGDFLGVEFKRNGGHADDTLDNTTWLIGLLFTYVASQ